MTAPVSPAAETLPPAVRARLDRFDRERFGPRLLARDPGLWGDDPVHREVAAHRLGWIDAPETMRTRVPELEAFAFEIRAAGFTHAVLLGMGGSSLAPEVLRLTCGVAPGGLELSVLDDTSPDAVRRVSATHDPATTLCLVSSKSGTTLEVAAFEKYFHHWVAGARGAEAGSAFVAITDPGTPLERLARARGYRRVFLNPPDIGGRYSALSLFGLVPAALLGIDPNVLLDGARAELARLRGAAQEVPGLRLGAFLGELACHGVDKVTLVYGRELAPLGAWIEQLLAESTGKEGRGLIPIAGEPLGPPEVYGRDRVFVGADLGGPEAEGEERLARLKAAGHPVLRWVLPSRDALGAEFMRWEIATAAAGAVLGVDPFDEPNVTEAKQATQAVLERFLAQGSFPATSALAERGALKAYTPSPTAAALRSRVADAGDPLAWATALASLAAPGDYFAVLAYLHRTPARLERLERLRLAARDATRLAATLGFGPRFLHSTGQLHKGGPNSGIFLQLTCDEPELEIPGERYGFGALRRAQAAGDYEVLERRGRRLLRVHLGAEVEAALDRLIEAFSPADRVGTTS